MCGINGIFNIDNFDYQYIAKMNEYVSKRGPDDTGFYINNEHRIALGHTRLSIVDITSNGHQPMFSDTKNSIIVLNGEIYNHGYLRDELKNKYNIHFKSKSDTEVLVNYIEKFGIEKCLSSINGMYAFAYYDFIAQKLIICRDKFGEKPLYVLRHNKGLIFSSDINSIKEAYNKFIGKLELNEESIKKLMLKNYIGETSTIYKNIFKLDFDSNLTIDLEKFEIKKNINFIKNKIVNKNLNYFNEKFKYIFEGVIAEYHNTEVPAGVFLSGGIDSTCIAIAASKSSKNQLHTYSVRYKNKTYDEGEIAEFTAKQIQSNHHEVYISEKDILDYVNIQSKVFSEPFTDSSQVPAFVLCKKASESIKVALTGDGGDEIFGGYNRYIVARNYGFIQKLPLVFKNKIIKIANIGSIVEPMINFFGVGDIAYKRNIINTLDKIKYFIETDNLDQFYSKITEVGSDEYLQESDSISNSNKIIYPISSWRDMMYQDRYSYMIDNNLQKLDRVSMYNGLECRVPFLDKRIVNFSNQIPNNLIINGKRGKIILREYIKNNIDSSHIDIKKAGFSIPIKEYLLGPLKCWSEEVIDTYCKNKVNIFNVNKVNLFYRDLIKKEDGNFLILWDILLLMNWINNEFKD